MSDLINRNDIYKLFEHGVAKLHVSDVDVIPTVDAVEVVHGKWIYDETTGEVRCNHCNAIVAVTMCKTDLDMILTDENFCFKCGAKMDEVSE